MTFQLFANLTPDTTSWIETLVNDGLYNGDYIYRAETGLRPHPGRQQPSPVQQRGRCQSVAFQPGETTTIDEEFNPDLTYTTAGTLAMARKPARFQRLGVLHHRRARRGASITPIRSSALRPWISQTAAYRPACSRPDSLPTTANSQGIHYLNTAVSITSASIVTDTKDGV